MIDIDFMPDFINIKEASEYLRIHRMTLYRLCVEKKFPATKVGGQWRIPKSRLISMFKAQV